MVKHHVKQPAIIVRELIQVNSEWTVLNVQLSISPSMCSFMAIMVGHVAVFLVIAPIASKPRQYHPKNPIISRFVFLHTVTPYLPSMIMNQGCVCVLLVQKQSFPAAVAPILRSMRLQCQFHHSQECLETLSCYNSMGHQISIDLVMRVWVESLHPWLTFTCPWEIHALLITLSPLDAQP